MGIKNLSKAFKATRTVKYKDLKGQTIAIDAMTELYRAALGAKTVSALTDAHGSPTMHINVILSIAIDLHRNGVKQIWVFDHNQDPDADFHNPMKIAELAKRKKKRDLAQEQMQSLTYAKDNSPMFSDSEDESESESAPESKPESKSKSASLATPASDETDTYTFDMHEPTIQDVVLTPEEEAHTSTLTSRQKAQFMLKKASELRKKYAQDLADYNFQKSKKDKINSLEKQTFSVSKDMINDIKFMFTCLNIKFIEAPSGFEGEAIASYLTQIGQADAVFSGDTDPIAYGANVLLRRNPRDKLIYEYTQVDILRQISEANDEYPNPTLHDFHVVAMALGTDACEKTPGIGPATVLKKLHLIELTPKQIAAMKEFDKVPEMSEIVTYNEDTEAFKDCQTSELLDWLVDEKSFSRIRVKTQLDKALIPEISKPAVRKTVVRKTHSKEPEEPEELEKKPHKKPILRRVAKK